MFYATKMPYLFSWIIFRLSTKNTMSFGQELNDEVYKVNRYSRMCVKCEREEFHYCSLYSAELFRLLLLNTFSTVDFNHFISPLFQILPDFIYFMLLPFPQVLQNPEKNSLSCRSITKDFGLSKIKFILY